MAGDCEHSLEGLNCFVIIPMQVGNSHEVAWRGAATGRRVREGGRRAVRWQRRGMRRSAGGPARCAHPQLCRGTRLWQLPQSARRMCMHPGLSLACSNPTAASRLARARRTCPWHDGSGAHTAAALPVRGVLCGCNPKQGEQRPF
jgi:hypothetical protein